MATHADSAAIVFIAAALIIGVSAGSDLKPVYFSLIVSRGEKGYNSSGVVPAIDLALETVQRRQLLPGYNLTYDKIKNSQVITSVIIARLPNLQNLKEHNS